MRTKAPNLKDSRLILQLPLPNLLKPGGKYIWVINKFIFYQSAAYIRGLAVRILCAYFALAIMIMCMLFYLCLFKWSFLSLLLHGIKWIIRWFRGMSS